MLPPKAVAARSKQVAKPAVAGGYYILRSLLADGVYKLGVTVNLNRRLLEHGGRDKHEVVGWFPMTMAEARRWNVIRREFYRQRITDGNEILALHGDDLPRLLDRVNELLLKLDTWQRADRNRLDESPGSL